MLGDDAVNSFAKQGLNMALNIISAVSGRSNGAGESFRDQAHPTKTVAADCYICLT